MSKRHNQLFTALRILLDMVLVAVAFWGAYALRFGSPRTWPYPELPQPRETFIVGAVALILWPLALQAGGAYPPPRPKNPPRAGFRGFQAPPPARPLLVAAP